LNANQALLVQQEQALESSANPTAQIKVSGGVRLHIAHSWGGGIERWVDDFVTVDTQPNFILQSETDPNAAGAALSLWMAWAGKKTKIALWHLATPIRATEIHHPEYAAILRDLVDKLAVQSLFVSSLIGHALDVFALRLPTIVILHDVYPFCPAFFAHYAGAACTRCDVNSLRTCQQDNPMYYFWHDTRPEWWVAFRGEYAMVIAAPWVQLVAPTHVAWARWQQLLPAIANLPCTIIGHGIDVLPRTLNSSLASGQRLRVVIPGRLVEHKGLSLVAELLPKLMNFADVFLLGCGGKGWAFVDMPQVKIVFDYPRGELADKIAEFRPDCALLLSIVPETFSYTLSEMQALGVPVVATNLGAYRERIEHDVTGWLVEPNVESILNLLRVLDAQRAQIQTVMQYWQMHLPTSIRTMLRQYLTLLPSSVVSARHSGFVDGVAQRVQQLQQDVWVLDEAGQHQKQEFEVALASAEHRASLAEHHLSVQTTLSAELFESQQRLLGSRSWRLTVPIRWLGSQVRVLRNRLSSRHDHAQSVGLPSPVVVALTGSASEDSSVPIQGAPDISSTSRRYDVSRAELCTLSGLPLATIWLGLDDPSPADLYPFTLIEFIKASCKHSNAIRFFMSDAAFEQVRHSEVGAAIYQLLTQRVIIRTPAEWDKLGRQFSGDCMVIFSNLKQQMASAACALLRSGCFLILWNDNQADILLPESAQIGRVMDSDWQEAALQLMAWLATDFVERQAIAKQSQTLPLCNDC
jgi:glycosyltransferase involved in cell wall biosynthesis